jgi:hypothetical protein
MIFLNSAEFGAARIVNAGTGVLAVTESGRRYEVPFDFVKLDGSWRLPPAKEDE